MPTQSNTRILEYGINLNSDNDCKIGERLQITCINPGRASSIFSRGGVMLPMLAVLRQTKVTLKETSVKEVKSLESRGEILFSEWFCSKINHV